MKPGIHPDYHQVTVHCACGNAFQTRSTVKGEMLRVEICSSCHPFFTGKQKFVDTAGRVERFQKKYADAASRSAAANSHASARAIPFAGSQLTRIVTLTVNSSVNCSAG